MALSTDPHIDTLIRNQSPVAFSVSGGKDGAAAAILVSHYLDSLRHPKNRRLLIHADLGRIEWRDSLPSCERLARLLDIPLVVVRRRGGGMVERWLQRWKSSCNRYANLECVTLIPPWSSASHRFCTSDLKRDVITSELRKRFNHTTILTVVGIRREESSHRAKSLVYTYESRLTKVTVGLKGLNWNAILDLSREEVFAVLAEAGLPAHEAYALGNTRVSCLFCVLANLNDLVNGAAQPEARDVYLELVSLEATSTFSFQPSRWLGDIAPALLSPALARDLATAKLRARERQTMEAAIPSHLRLVGGRAFVLPTHDEAELLARVRRRVCSMVGIESPYLTEPAVQARYRELQQQEQETLALDV